MGNADYLKLGDYNVTCSMCRGKFKASELIKHWQGQYRCERCWEPRHPQDFVRGVLDNPSVSWSQPLLKVNVLTGEFIITEDSNVVTGELNILMTENNDTLITES